MRKVRQIRRLWCIIGWRREQEGLKGRVQDTSSDLHLYSVLQFFHTPTNHPTQLSSNPNTNSLPLHPHFTCDCVETVISVILDSLEEHKKGLNVRNGCGDQNFYMVNREILVEGKHVSEWVNVD